MLYTFFGGDLFASIDAQRRPRSTAAPPLDGAPDMDQAILVLLAAGGIIVLFGIIVLILRQFLFICRPNEILVFSGRKHVLPDGTVSGYKILHGGRGVRVPFLETVSRMDMRLFPVEVQVHNAYSKGGIPLSVHAIANVKVASSDTGVRNAVERFLGTSLDQIAIAAQQTLEGVLREVISQLTPEEVNEDRLKFAETLVDNARDDFDKLGLELDVLKVQHVADDQHYLANLGRGRIATMLRDAANAENAANQAVAEAQAAARQNAETATKQAETVIAQVRNNYRGENAKLEAEAKQLENEGLPNRNCSRCVPNSKSCACIATSFFPPKPTAKPRSSRLAAKLLPQSKTAKPRPRHYASSRRSGQPPDPSRKTLTCCNN
jgi:flotillin